MILKNGFFNVSAENLIVPRYCIGESSSFDNEVPLSAPSLPPFEQPQTNSRATRSDDETAYFVQSRSIFVSSVRQSDKDESLIEWNLNRSLWARRFAD